MSKPVFSLKNPYRKQIIRQLNKHTTLPFNVIVYLSYLLDFYITKTHNEHCHQCELLFLEDDDNAQGFLISHNDFHTIKPCKAHNRKAQTIELGICYGASGQCLGTFLEVAKNQLCKCQAAKAVALFNTLDSFTQNTVKHVDPPQGEDMPQEFWELKDQVQDQLDPVLQQLGGTL